MPNHKSLHQTALEHPSHCFTSDHSVTFNHQPFVHSPVLPLFFMTLQTFLILLTGKHRTKTSLSYFLMHAIISQQLHRTDSLLLNPISLYKVTKQQNATRI